MIRPLIVSLYDYRMVFQQELAEPQRNAYKMHYLEASAFAGAGEIYCSIDQQGVDPEEAIRQWNEKGQEQGEGRVDFRSKIDEMFRTNNRTYYRNREQERTLGKDKNEDYRSPSKAEFLPRYSSSSSFSLPRYHSPHSKDAYYAARYKPDRY